MEQTNNKQTKISYPDLAAKVKLMPKREWTSALRFLHTTDLFASENTLFCSIFIPEMRLSIDWI